MRAAHVNAGWPADFDGDGARGLSDHDPQVARFSSRARLSVDDASVVEGNSGRRPLTFNARFSRALSVDVTLCALTLPLGATPWLDFRPIATCRTVPAGSTEVPITVDVWGDRRREIDERLALVVLTSDGLDLEVDIGVGTIRDDD